MKLLANENFPMDSVKHLINGGFDIKAIGTHNPSISDNEVMEIAIKEARTILTIDRDYGDLIFKHNYRPEMGVIYIRLDVYESNEPGKIIEELIKDAKFDFQKKFTVITMESVRQRGY